MKNLSEFYPWLSDQAQIFASNPDEVFVDVLFNVPESEAFENTTLRVTIVPPQDNLYSYSSVYYRKIALEEENESDYIWNQAGFIVDETQELDIVVPSDGRDYEISVRGVSTNDTESLTGVSVIVSVPFSVIGVFDASDLVTSEYVPNVTGIEIFNKGNEDTFSGRSVKFTWRAQADEQRWAELGLEGPYGAGSTLPPLFLRDYVIQIFAEGELVRTEFSTDTQYTYAFEDNSADYFEVNGVQGAWRTFAIEVRARANLGFVSEIPARFEVRNPPPELPEDLIVTGGFARIEILYNTPPSDPDFEGIIVWLSETDTLKEFQVFKGSGNSVSLSGVVLRDEFGNPVFSVDAAKTYRVDVASYDSFGYVGEAPISSFSVTTLSASNETPPDKPLNLVFNTELIQNEVDVSAEITGTWDEVVNVRTHYVVEVADTNLPSTITRFITDTNSFGWQSAIPGQDYTIRVKGLNAESGVEGAWSDPVNITAAFPINPPGEVVVGDVVAGPNPFEITIYWTNPSDLNYDLTSVHRSTVSSFSPSVANQVFIGRGARGQIQSFIDSVPAGTRYYYQIVTRSLSGVTSSSVIAGNAVAFNINSGNMDDYIDPETPATITSVSLSTGISESGRVATAWVRAAWSYTTDLRLAGYEYEWQNLNISKVNTGYVGVDDLENTFERAIPGNSYRFRVRASTFNGIRGAWSNWFSINAAYDTSAPGSPTGVSISSGLDKVVLEWTNPFSNNLIAVDIHRATSGRIFSPTTLNRIATVNVEKGKSSVYIDADVTFGTTYFYIIRTVSSSGVLGSVIYASSTSGNSPLRITAADVDNFIDVGAIGNVQLSDASVDADKLTNLSVTAAKLASDSVTSTKIANLAVGNAAIANSAITNAKIANLAVDAAKIDNLAVTEAKIANLAVTNAKIANLDAAKITTGSLDAARIATTSLNADNITTGSLDAARIATTALNADNITSGTITGRSINGGTITGSLVRTASSDWRVELGPDVTSTSMMRITDGTTTTFNVSKTGVISLTGYAEEGDIPNNLAELDSAANTTLNNTANLANTTSGVVTAGLDENGNVRRFINGNEFDTTTTTPASTGLYLTKTHLGYYSTAVPAGVPNWRSVITNTGQFSFYGDSNNFINFNGSTLKIKSNNIEISSAQFTLDASGNAAFSGNLYAASGSFSGSVTITGGSGISNLTDAGEMATKDNVASTDVTFNYAGSSSKGGNANDTNAVAGTAASTVASGANRAISGLNASGDIQRVVGAALPTINPTTVGLHMNKNYFGYYLGGGVWGNYFKSDGDALIGKSNGNKIFWDQSAETLTVQGTVAITGGSGIANLSDAGELATADSTDPRVSNSLKENNVVVVSRPEGGRNYFGATSGEIRVLLPILVSRNNSRVRFTIDFMSSRDDRNFSLEVYGYNSTVGWSLVSARMVGVGSTSLPVKFGYISSRACVAVGVGSPATQLGVLNVSVRDVQVYGGSNFTTDAWRQDWQVIRSTINLVAEQTVENPLIDSKDTLNVDGTPSSEIREGSDKANTGLNAAGNIIKPVDSTVLPSLTPSQSGLYYTSDYIGFYRAGVGAGWKTVFKSDGDAVIGDSSSTNYVFWDQSAGKLTVAGELVAATGTFAGDISAASGTFSGKVSVSSGNAITVVGTNNVGGTNYLLSSTINGNLVFGVDTLGGATFSGKVIAGNGSNVDWEYVDTPTTGIPGTQIESLSADKLTAGTIDASVIAVTNLNASNITSGTINANTIGVTNLNASNITSGTINASTIGVTNLNASNITTGTLNAARIGTNSITATQIDVADLYSTNATITGTLAIGSGGSISGNNYSFNDTGGQIAGWTIENTQLSSNPAGIARMVMDKTNNRFSVVDAAGSTKVAMGYLGGLAKAAPATGSWSSSDYGFWAADGDTLMIDGDAEYTNGDWLIKNDASYLVQNSSDIDIIRLGTDGGTKGLFFYNGAATNVKLAEYTAGGITIGDTSGNNYITYTTAGGLTVRGSLNADDITTGTLDASTVNVTNISADDITSGTITGRTFQTSSSGARAIIDSTKQAYEYFNSSGDLVFHAGPGLPPESSGYPYDITMLVDGKTNGDRFGSIFTSTINSINGFSWAIGAACDGVMSPFSISSGAEGDAGIFAGTGGNSDVRAIYCTTNGSSTDGGLALHVQGNNTTSDHPILLGDGNFRRTFIGNRSGVNGCLTLAQMSASYYPDSFNLVLNAPLTNKTTYPIGSIVLATHSNVGTEYKYGDTISGSSLRPSSAAATFHSTYVNIGGTWQCLGYASALDQPFYGRTTLWVKIA